MIEEAGDGEEALAAVARRRPDLVIIERRMPKLDGLEVIRALRAAPATHNLPVLLLNLDEDATRDGFATSADDSSTKPVHAGSDPLARRALAAPLSLGERQEASPRRLRVFSDPGCEPVAHTGILELRK